MKKGITILILLGLVVVGVVYLNESREQSVIKVGAVLPLSGPGASFGEVLKTGYEWKVEQLQDSGIEVELFIADGASNPKDSISAFRKLVEVDQVEYIFTTLSSVSMSIKPIAGENEVLLWAHAAHPELTEGSSYVLQHSNTADADATAMARHILEHGYKNVAIVYQQDDWGIVFAKKLEQIVQQNGLEYEMYPVDHRASDFRTSMTELASRDHDVLASIVFGPASGIIPKQVRKLGFIGQVYSSVGFALTANAAEIAGEAIDGMYYQTYLVTDEFEQDYLARFGEKPKPFAVIAYTGLELLTDVLSRSEDRQTTPLEVIEHIKQRGQFFGTYETPDITEFGSVIVKTVIKRWEE